MIIQCDKCLSKFKLDDSKVTPQGVKVKCKKCSNIFMVFPEKPEEELKIEFPEETFLTETKEETKKVEAEEEKIKIELPSFEMTLEGETEKKPKTEELQIKKEPQEEFSWDQFNLELEEKKEESKPVIEEEQPLSQEFDFESFGEVKLSAEEKVESSEEKAKEEVDLDFSFEKFSQEVSAEKEETKIEKPQKTLEEFVFEAPETETKETAPESETKAEEELTFDFEFQEPDAQAGKVVLQEPISEEVKTAEIEGSVFSEEAVTTPEAAKPSEEVFAFEEPSSYSEEEKQVIETEEQPLDTFVFSEPEAKEESFEFIEEPPKPEAEEPTPTPLLEFETVKPQRNWLAYIVFVLLVVVLSGSGVAAIWWQKTKILETEGNFGITGVKFDVYESKTLDKVFVVTGKTVNNYRVPKSFIKIRATVKSKDNKILIQKTVFAGNVFLPSEIKELTYLEIEKGLNNKMGKSMMNVDIPSGKSLPFMIIFDKLPPEATNIEVESI